MSTRAEFKQLADERLLDAELLLKNGRWPAAYYLAGYSIECALKACIASLMKAEVFPDKKFAEKCYTHDIERLVLLAELKTDRDNDAAANPNLFANWATVKDWSEEFRYELTEESSARMLYDAITDAKDGVMPWIKSRW